jgi:hypothetical protein
MEFIVEMTKKDIMTRTQHKILEKALAELQLKVTTLEQQLEKINKKKIKEVNTSEF